MDAKISAVIIAKDEEARIKACLESIRWVDEIIVVDGMSTDSTRDICLKYTDKVFIKKMVDFSVQRSFGVEQASGEWILSIDADEIMDKELIEEIKMLPGAIMDKYNAFRIPIKHYFFGKEIKYGGWCPAILRFFRKEKGHWQGAVHERLAVEGKTGYLKGCLHHHAYDSISEFINKTNIYTTEEVKKRNVNTNVFMLVFIPIKVFLSRYILKQGFRDGMHGLIIALLMSFYAFTLRAKKWEKQLKRAS